MAYHFEEKGSRRRAHLFRLKQKPLDVIEALVQAVIFVWEPVQVATPSAVNEGHTSTFGLVKGPHRCVADARTWVYPLIAGISEGR